MQSTNPAEPSRGFGQPTNTQTYANTAILTKLHKIMSEVGVLDKDKKNTFHNYEYLSESAIKKAIQPLLIKHGVLFTISLDTAHQPNDKITYANLKYRFADIDTGQELIGDFVGTGEDKGDKGLYKAITGAIKYILTTTFLIPTNDDPENEGPAKKPVARTAAPRPAAPTSAPRPIVTQPDAPISQAQINKLTNDMRSKGLTLRDLPEPFNQTTAVSLLTKGDASKIIDWVFHAPAKTPANSNPEEEDISLDEIPFN